MAGYRTVNTRNRATAPTATLPSQETETAFARALGGRRFDDPGTGADRIVLCRVNLVDPGDIPED